MFGFAVLSVALLAGQAAASTISTRSPLVSALRARQADFDPSTVPPQCKSDCADISSVLTSATCSNDITCVCSSSASNGLFSCLQCALNLAPSQSLLDQAQESYNDYAQACSSGNMPVSAQTLSIPSGSSASATGGSSRGTGVRTSAAAAPTASGSSTTTTSGDDGDGDSDSGSDGDSGSSGNSIKHNGALFGVSASSVGVAGAVGAMMALLAL
ncbi:hypothetical protein C8Q77DRAFT_133065 [Trametes polyzona]|nr:hypothetical protein C8Q77DRAFT_133065 [Trametes polyzona]